MHGVDVLQHRQDLVPGPVDHRQRREFVVPEHRSGYPVQPEGQGRQGGPEPHGAQRPQGPGGEEAVGEGPAVALRGRGPVRDVGGRGRSRCGHGSPWGEGMAVAPDHGVPAQITGRTHPLTSAVFRLRGLRRPAGPAGARRGPAAPRLTRCERNPRGRRARPRLHHAGRTVQRRGDLADLPAGGPDPGAGGQGHPPGLPGRPPRRRPQPLPGRRPGRRDLHGLPVRRLRCGHALRQGRAALRRPGALAGAGRRRRPGGADPRHQLRLTRPRRADAQADRPATGRLHRAARRTGGRRDVGGAPAGDLAARTLHQPDGPALRR